VRGLGGLRLVEQIPLRLGNDPRLVRRQQPVDGCRRDGHYLPRKSTARFSTKAATPSRKSSVCDASVWRSASSSSCWASVLLAASSKSRFVSAIARVGPAASSAA